MYSLLGHLCGPGDGQLTSQNIPSEPEPGDSQCKFRRNFFGGPRSHRCSIHQDFHTGDATSSVPSTFAASHSPAKSGHILYMVRKSRFRFGPGAHSSFPESTESACRGRLQAIWRCIRTGRPRAATEVREQVNTCLNTSNPYPAHYFVTIVPCIMAEPT